MTELKKKIVEKLEWLAEFGKDPTGGISRFLYSESWVEAQNALKQWIRWSVGKRTEIGWRCNPYRWTKTFHCKC